MDLSGNTPIALAERRLSWLDARQRILAQNVANADTPNYRPSDAVPFAEMLARRTSARAMAATSPLHLQAGQGPLAVQDRALAERARGGNAVSLDDEALRIAETDQAHALALGLHRKYLGLFRTALGRP